LAKFEKIENLLGELYKHRNLFTALFDNRMFPIQEEMVLPLVDHDTEKLERLAAFDLLFRNQSQISLESRMQEFFEEFLEVDETVHVLYIQENLNQIKTNQSYYLKENQANKRDQYLIKIKKHLWRINPINPTFMTDISDAYESAYTIMLNLNRTWIKKQGDFFVESPIILLAAIIWYLKIYKVCKYCTFPHAIEFLNRR